jgi:hypothetical protein
VPIVANTVDVVFSNAIEEKKQAVILKVKLSNKLSKIVERKRKKDRVIIRNHNFVYNKSDNEIFAQKGKDTNRVLR